MSTRVEDVLHVGEQVVAQHLARRYIDGDENRRIDVERLLPGREFARRALQGEQAEIDDEAGLLGERNKFARLDAAKARMLPAQQRLEAGDGAILEPHDGLEEQLDFVAVQRAAQFAFQRLAVGALRAHGGPENLDAAAAVALGVAHGDLGVLEHVLALGMPLRIEQGDADRNARARFPVGEGHRRRERAPDLVGERDDLLRCRSPRRESPRTCRRKCAPACRAAATGGRAAAPWSAGSNRRPRRRRFR